jgi:predicted transcriptional regulator
MTYKQSGPKTGSFEPPAYVTYDRSEIWDTIKSIHNEIECKEKNIRELIQLTNEIIAAYENNDKDSLPHLLKEFEFIKKNKK